MRHTGRIWVLLTLTLITVAGVPHALAQRSMEVALDSVSNGSTVTFDGTIPLTITDESRFSTSQPYSRGRDYTLTVTGGCHDSLRAGIRIMALSLGCGDTLYFYDGPDTTGSLRAKLFSQSEWEEDDIVVVSPDNATGTFTLRFRTTAGDTCPQGAGFILRAGCFLPCETATPIFDTLYFRTRNGVVYDTARLRWMSFDEGPDLPVADLCIGDGVVFRAHGKYTHRHGYHHPSDSTTLFTWSTGTNADTLSGTGLTTLSYDNYSRLRCSNLTLQLTESQGCESSRIGSMIVRTAANPFREMEPLLLCGGEKGLGQTSYHKGEAPITLRRIRPEIARSKFNPIRVFIPDGGSASAEDTAQYYEAPVEYTEFTADRALGSGDEIYSICVNMEHSYMGDIALSIVCPSGQEAFLKYGRHTPNRPSGPGSEHGGNTHMGYPIRGWDGTPTWDSTANPYGIGLNYCFSRNENYTLVTGEPANFAGVARPSGNHYLGSEGNIITEHVVFPPVPAGFVHAGQAPPAETITTRQPSDPEERINYYLPYSSFNELVGCPLNGVWKLRVYDNWTRDNGWVFGWSMDIRDYDSTDCMYNVEIDSVVWRPDTAGQHIAAGSYHGLMAEASSNTKAWLYAYDTAGRFPVTVTIYDNFGCVWDSTTHVNIVRTPKPSLGDDTSSCPHTSLYLYDRDPYTHIEHYTYTWKVGSESESGDWEFLATPPLLQQYTVEACNNKGEKECCGSDTIEVTTLKKPSINLPNDSMYYSGCDQLTIPFTQASPTAVWHHWDFGDGDTSILAEPQHTWGVGNYTLQYIAVSENGCADTLNANIIVLRTPRPDLGPDLSICVKALDTITLRDHAPGAGTEGYTYSWTPDGRDTCVIHPIVHPSHDTVFLVEVTNRHGQIACRGTDSLRLRLLRKPELHIIPDPTHLSGCESVDIQFENASINADRHFWNFGDGETSRLASPFHSWRPGFYDLLYIASSEDGCADTLTLPHAVSVYIKPTADFTWMPANPTSAEHYVHFDNHTSPDIECNVYQWQVQYNTVDTLAADTLVAHDPTYDFTMHTTDGILLPGGYPVRLIASITNTETSGLTVVCADTAEAVVTVLGDILFFPNLVTPNGDGINDRFIIGNLLESRAFPRNALVIYNAWGNLMYSHENIDSVDDFWNPAGLPDGTYYYRFTGRGEIGAIEHSGVIEVLSE